MSINDFIDNKINPTKSVITGLIGDHPSTYSKSPAMWNNVFSKCNIDAEYFCFDVQLKNFGSLVNEFKKNNISFQVTVPYKQEIIKYLDYVDPIADKLKTVNTVVNKDGKLHGYSTDGIGFVYSLKSVMPNLLSKNVLLIGAGGAANSIAFAIKGKIGNGNLYIANRTLSKSEELCNAIKSIYTDKSVYAYSENDIPSLLHKVDLVINGTTKGQQGISKIGDKYTSFEDYSALAPASPRLYDSEPTVEKVRNDNYEDILKNNTASLEMLSGLKDNLVFADIVYAPPESVYLQNVKEYGFKFINGRGMLIGQAVEGFLLFFGDKVSSDQLFDLMFEGFNKPKK